MRTLNLTQGSDEWLSHRRTTRNASEAPALMGASPYVTRSQLLHQLATGIEREIDDATQRVFNHGHAVEPKLRAIAESIIGEDLYPVTGVSDDGYLGASFDGVTLGEDVILEAKQSNTNKLECIARSEIPYQDYWQIVQQFAVCESAKKCMYIVGDGTDAGTAWMFIARQQIAHDIPKLIASWQQFDADVAAYVPEPVAAAAPTGRAPETLPALSIQVTGMVTASNLAEFKANALAVLSGINRKLTTDEDFADAEKTVKWCQGVEERLAATKQQVLGQTADIDAVFRTMDEVSAETRRIRLDLDKLVTREKENRKLEIVNRCKAAYEAHVTELRAETNGVWLNLNAPDLAGAIRGKKSLKSMQDACDTVLAQAKIAANESARHIRAALACLSEETAEHKHLFPDYLNFIAKPVDDIRALVRGRIAEHKQREEQKAEQLREQIRKEEADKLAKEQAKQTSAAGAPVAQQPLYDSANNPGLATGSRNESTSESVTRGNLPPTTSAAISARIRIGDINAAIAPLSITAEGLATLGFQPAQSKGAAKLYAADDFPRICAALVRVVNKAQARAAEQPIAGAPIVRTAA